MTSYFTSYNAKSALKSDEIFTGEGSRPDLLLEQYKLTRARLMTHEKAREINDMYMKWCDLLFSGFNIVVLGAQSKFSLLETFKRKYLDSDRIPDFRTATGFNANGEERNKSSREPTPAVAPMRSTSSRRATRSRKTPQSAPAPVTCEPSRLKCLPPPAPTLLGVEPELCPMLDIVTVRMHGLDPIKPEAFNHALFDIKESRRAKDSDYKEFIRQARADNQHYVFLIHSFEYFLKECEDVCETIFRLYALDPIHVHLVMSSDVLNAGKKLNNLKIKLSLVFFVAPFSESFLREKTELMNEFEEGDGGPNNETTVHRLFNDKTDLQSLKDIYQALDGATASIMKYILRDYLEKCQANQNGDETEFVPYALVPDLDEDDGVEQNRTRPKRAAKAERAAGKRTKTRRATKIGSHLDFHHLLAYCESKFIIRRGAALRDHLGELKDHSIISEDEAGNKIQCLIGVRMCEKFLDWAETQDN